MEATSREFASWLRGGRVQAVLGLGFLVVSYYVRFVGYLILGL